MQLNPILFADGCKISLLNEWLDTAASCPGDMVPGYDRDAGVLTSAALVVVHCKTAW